VSTQPFVGSRNLLVSPHVALCCMSPDARDLLERVMERWEEHKTSLPKKLTYNGETWNPRESVYEFAYWLIRWSGLVQPAASEEREVQP
jgi:hypothetical protein